MFNIYIIIALLAITYLFINKKKPLIISKPNTLLIVIPFIVIMTTFLCLKSFKMAPNPGYANSIININAILVILFTMIYYKQRLNRYSVLGSVFVLVGIILIINFSKVDKDIKHYY